MRYNYANTTQTPITLEFTLIEMTSLIQLLEPIAADHDNDQRYNADVFARALKDAHAKACVTMTNDLAYMTKLTT